MSLYFYTVCFIDAVLVTIHHDDPEVPEELLAKIEGAFIVKPDPVDKNMSLLIDVVTGVSQNF